MSHLQGLYETWALVTNNVWGKLFTSLESLVTFDEICKVTLVPFFMSDFNLLKISEFIKRVRQFYV